MNEALLQFIWQYSLYNPVGLRTISGEALHIIHPGRLNKNAGPDFLEAKVKVGDTTLVGNIELHINSSDWLKHGHQDDQAYQNLVLHVVYNNDAADVVANTPVLEIASNVPQYVLAKYAGLMQVGQTLPCASQLSRVRDITKESWLSRLLAERWEQKLSEWKDLLDTSAGDWQNLLYWRTAANFGFKVNATPFLMLARSIPLIVLAKHRDNLQQLEALLFGQAGMLNEEFEEEYPRALQREYRYLRQKYSLEPIASYLWKFLRMRPANFPTIRIAQFAALVHRSVHLFSQIVETSTVKEIEPLFDIKASEYWNTHFRFNDEAVKPSEKRLGKSSIQNIIINTIAPIQFLYAHQQGTTAQQERALQLLDTVHAETNNITELWESNAWKPVNAAQSQAMIQLYNNYCTPKRCLECAIGLNIIKAG